MSPTMLPPATEARKAKNGPCRPSLAELVCLASGQCTASAEEAVLLAGNDIASLRHSFEAAQATDRQVLTGTDLPAGATREEVLERNHLMEELVGSLRHALEATERLPDLRLRIAAQETRAREWAAFPNPPPYGGPVARGA